MVKQLAVDQLMPVRFWLGRFKWPASKTARKLRKWKRKCKVVVAFIGDLNSANSRVLWVTAEAIPRVKDEEGFLEISKELIERLTKQGVLHELQDHRIDLEVLKDAVDEIVMYTPIPVVFITSEEGRYRSITDGREVIRVRISRKVDIPSWRTMGHKKEFPIMNCNGNYRIFLDTVSFTGRTVEEVDSQYSLHLAGIELVGKYAIEKVYGKIRIPITRSRNVPDFDGVWHLDDFVQDIETEDGVMRPSEFLAGVYGNLRETKIREEFERMLREARIKTEQTSPNLFLELSRPNSYLARSFHPEKVEEVVGLVERMEKLYGGKNGN